MLTHILDINRCRTITYIYCSFAIVTTWLCCYLSEHLLADLIEFKGVFELFDGLRIRLLYLEMQCLTEGFLD